jgi:hypothetical protein
MRGVFGWRSTEMIGGNSVGHHELDMPWNVSE